MRVLLVVEIEVADTGNVAALVGAIRAGVEQVAADAPAAGIGMTAHTGDAAERIAAVVRTEMGAH